MHGKRDSSPPTLRRTRQSGEVPALQPPKGIAANVHSWIACSPMNTLRIDSHQHFWRPARGDYAWLRADVPALAPLRRDFLPEELAPLLQRHDVRAHRARAGRRRPRPRPDFLLELAGEHDFVGGVVGWLDLSSEPMPSPRSNAGRGTAKFRACARCCKTCPTPTGSRRAPHPAAVRALCSLGAALRRAGEAAAARRRCCASCAAIPSCRWSIDHAAKPQLARRAGTSTGPAAGSATCAALAAHPAGHAASSPAC